MYCGQRVGRIKMKLGMQVGLGPGHIVLDGDPAPLSHSGPSSHPQRKLPKFPTGDTASPTQLLPNFSAHICCGQMAEWMKIPLSTEVDLSPGIIVLHGDPAHPPPKEHSSPASFRPMYLVVTVARLSYCWALVAICVSLMQWHWRSCFHTDLIGVVMQ